MSSLSEAEDNTSCVLRDDSGVSALVTEKIILQGFGLTALTCCILCVGILVLIFFTRSQAHKKEISLPIQEQEQLLPVSCEG